MGIKILTVSKSGYSSDLLNENKHKEDKKSGVSNIIISDGEIYQLQNVLLPTSVGMVALKTGRREVPGSNLDRTCRPSSSEFSLVFSETRLNTG